MRRKDKEITDPLAIEAIIQSARICRLGLIDEGRPYIVPLCFGYRKNAIFIHSASEGKKIEALRKNPLVCAEFDINTEIVKSEKACNWGMKFQSVIVFGRAFFLDTISEKRNALHTILDHYACDPDTLSNNRLITTAVIRIDIERMTGKQAGY